MIKTTIIETNKFVDINNELSNNEYLKTIKLFGIKLYQYYYKLDVTLPDRSGNIVKGFQNEQNTEES